jgi:hypothetical protein
MIRTITFLIFAAALSGCLTAYPTDSISDIELEARSVLPSTVGHVEFMHTGCWVPGTGSISSVIAFSDAAKLVRGVLAVTEDGIFFVVWDKSKATYLSELHIPADDVRSVTASESWRTRGKLIVVERKGKYSGTQGIGTASKAAAVEGFLITSARGVGDEDKTEKALDALSRLVTT